MDDDALPPVLVLQFERVHAEVHLARTGVASDENELVAQVESGVVLDGQVVGAVLAAALVGEVARVDGLVDLRRLVAAAGDLDEEEELVEDVVLLVTDVTLEFRLDVLEDRLDRVAVGVAWNEKKNPLREVRVLTKIL